MKTKIYRIYISFNQVDSIHQIDYIIKRSKFISFIEKYAVDDEIPAYSDYSALKTIFRLRALKKIHIFQKGMS